MADKYMTLENGKRKMQEATDTSTGVAEAGDLVALDSTGKLDPSLLPAGIAADVKVAEASENLSAGDYVNIWNDGGTEKVRLADHSNDRPAHGFVKDAVTAASNATVYFEGSNDDLSGLTPGERQYLDVTGGITSTPQTTGIHQLLGIAVSPTEINTDIQDCIVL